MREIISASLVRHSELLVEWATPNDKCCWFKNSAWELRKHNIISSWLTPTEAVSAVQMLDVEKLMLNCIAVFKICITLIIFERFGIFNSFFEILRLNCIIVFKNGFIQITYERCGIFVICWKVDAKLYCWLLYVWSSSWGSNSCKIWARSKDANYANRGFQSLQNLLTISQMLQVIYADNKHSKAYSHEVNKAGFMDSNSLPVRYRLNYSTYGWRQV